MEENQVPEIESQARELGWQPEEEFKANPANEGKKWRSAEDFMDRKSLFDKIEDQHKEIRNLKKGVDALTIHNRTIEESAYKRALQDLRAERKRLLEEGEFAKAEEVRDQMDELRAKQPAVQAQPQEPPELTSWRQKNTWYNDDPDMTAWADSKAQLLARSGKTPNEVLSQLEKDVRTVFPQKFRNPNKEDAPRTESPGTKSKSDSFRLTAEEERVMRTMLRAGVKMTEQEYKEQIKKSRGV